MKYQIRNNSLTNQSEITSEDVLLDGFVSVLWYRNVSSEVSQGRLGLLGNKRKLFDLRKICHTCIFLCTEMLQKLTRLDEKNMDATASRVQHKMQQLCV